MKKLILLLTICLTGIADSQAQNKWFVSPGAGYAFVNERSPLYADLTVGRYLGTENRYRVDLLGSYLFSEGDGQFAVAGMFTLGEWLKLKVDRFQNTSSIGIGIMKSRAGNRVDLMIPLKTGFGYNITDFFAVGIDIGINFNLNDFSHGSYAYCGISLAFRLGGYQN